MRAKHATLGITPTNHSYSVRVAISRRRYSQLIFYSFTKGTINQPTTGKHVGIELLPLGEGWDGAFPPTEANGGNESAALTVEPHIIKHFKEILLAD
ncbi:MAG TPA: hypothetical protein DCL18_05825 [Prevotella sp.]|nr:hypothetical protein [Prevotella sp.]